MSEIRTTGIGPAPRRAASLLLFAAIAAAGCESIGQDLSDFAENLAPPTPGEAARMAVDPDDADQRRKGVLLLAGAPFGSQDVYLAMYRDYVGNERNPLVKAVAIRALARHGAPEDATLIADSLEHENLQVRWEAAKGLQRIHEPSVVPKLLSTLRDVQENSDVRVAAARALGQYREDRVFQGLVAALDARELAVNVAAQRSLEILTGQAMGLDPRPWLSWYNERGDQAFGAAEEYLYPTYQRERSWFEKLAFWSNVSFEQPGVPIGLRTQSGRRTYDDADADPDIDTPRDSDADAEAGEGR